MPSEVELLYNVPCTELRREGWGLSKTAAAFRAAKLVDGFYRPASFGEDEPSEGEFDDDPGLFQIPDEGVLILCPSPLRPDLNTNAEFQAGWIRATALDKNPDDFTESILQAGGSEPNLYKINRASMGASLNGLGFTPVGYSGVDIEAKYGLRWIARTRFSLYPNEVWSLILNPIGLPNDTAQLCAVGFGGMWMLVIGTNNTAQILQNIGTTSDEKWVERDKFSIAQGGAGMQSSIQITCIPWGYDAITFVFSSVGESKKGAKAAYSSSSGAYTVHTKKLHYEPAKDPSINHYVKTKAAALSFAFAKDTYLGAFALLRGRFLGSGLTLMPEALDETKSTAPNLTTVGFFGIKSPGHATTADTTQAKSSSTLGPKLVNEQNQSWLTTRDVQAVAKCWLRPTGDGVYSPELWGMDYEVAPETHELTNDPINYSTKWRKISFTRSIHADSDHMTVILDRSNEWPLLFKIDGRVELSVDGVVCFEGHMIHPRPVMEGAVGFQRPDDSFTATLMVTDEPEFADLFEGLNETNVAHFTTLTNNKFGPLIRKALKAAGNLEADIVVSSDLEDLKIGDWDQANDWKSANEDTTSGDLLRMLQDRFGTQATQGDGRKLVFLRRERKWYAELTPDYDPEETELEQAFMLDARVMAGDEPTDAERWAGLPDGFRYYKALGKPEFNIARPKYNGLRARATVGTGDGADLVAAFIAPDPAILDDPEHVAFQSRARILSVDPPETAIASTQEEIERLARRRFDADCRPKYFVSVPIEWRPEVDVNQLVLLVGLAPQDGGEFLQGDVVSYGAYLIEGLSVELTMDDSDDDPPEDAIFGPVAPTRKWTHTAMASLRYVGPTQIDWAPMFTETLPYL